MNQIYNSGNIGTLIASFIYLCVSFMAWVSLSPLMIYITHNIDIPIESKLRLSSLAVVSGSLLRIPIGLASDQYGTRVCGIIIQIIALIAVTTVYLIGLKSYSDILIFSLCLGFSGASFAIALPQASRWYSSDRQGLILGIVGAGNMGVAFTAIYAPYIAEHYSWQLAYGVLATVMSAAFIIYLFFSHDAPNSTKQFQSTDYVTILTSNHGRLYMFLYSITFGGFVGLSASLPMLFNSQYHVSGIISGILTAITIFIGSIARPIGGYLADKYGAKHVLIILLIIISLAYALLSAINLEPLDTFNKNKVEIFTKAAPLISAFIFTMCSLFLGMGNGAIFQKIGQIFQVNIGAATGIVGAAGGIGGYFLAEVLARSREQTGGFGYGYASLCILAIIGLTWLNVSSKDMND